MEYSGSKGVVTVSRFEQQLKPCPYCGGKAKLKTKRKNYSLNIGANKAHAVSERFIRCETCHARTQARGKIVNLVNAWNMGIVYPCVYE